MTLTTSANEIDDDEVSTATITATMIDSGGRPVLIGTSVTFTTTLGIFSNGSRTMTVTTPTDAGTASVTLIAQAENGIAEVTAISNNVTRFVYIAIGQRPGGAVATMTLSALPPSIANDGVATTTLTATLIDINGVAVDVGTEVRFVTSLGTFTNGRTEIVAFTTTTAGTASVVLIGGEEQGIAEITAFSGGLRVIVTVAVGETPPGNTRTILIEAADESIPADGVSSTTITVTLLDPDGQGVAPGTAVTLTTTRGRFSNGSTTTTLFTTTEAGTATTSLIAGTSPGPAEIRATANGATAIIVVLIGETGDPGRTASITLEANPLRIPADGTSSLSITATLTDNEGNSVLIGTVVTFTTNLGTFSNGAQSITVLTDDTSGTATVSLISSTTSGTATVTAASNGVVQTIEVFFTTTTPGETVVINISPAEGSEFSQEVETGGVGRFTLEVELLDGNLDPVFIGTTADITIEFPIGVVIGTDRVSTLSEDGKFNYTIQAVKQGAGSEVIRVTIQSGTDTETVLLEMTAPATP